MKALIFDLDGVIVFTDRFHYEAWKKMADRRGIYFDERINHRLRGVSRAESLEIILERYTGKPPSNEEKAAMMEEKNESYKRLLSSLTPADVSDQVRDTLRHLRERGYKLAIGSSSKNAAYILERIDLAGAFDAVADGNGIFRSKPHPEVFLKAARLLLVSPKDCAVIEDARAGIDAAKAAGMMAVGIGEAASYEKTDQSIESVKDLDALFSNNP